MFKHVWLVLTLILSFGVISCLFLILFLTLILTLFYVVSLCVCLWVIL